MYTKLKLKIKLEENFTYNTKYYTLIINCLNKDYRFETSYRFKPIIYNSKIIQDFKIASSFYQENGRIFYYANMYTKKYTFELYLPSTENLNKPIIYDFRTDVERKMYLNNLFIVLAEWSNYWEQFFYDTKSELDITDDIVKVFCDVIDPDI